MKYAEMAIVTLVPLSMAFAGCGPNIEFQTSATTGASSSGDGSGGGAGSGGAGGTGGNGLACTSLVVQPTVIAMTALEQSSPRIGLDPATGQVVYAFINGPVGMAGSLHTMTANVFDAWPPTWTPAQMVDSDVNSIAMGEGPKGPVGLVRHANTPPRLVDSFVPQFNFVDTPMTDEGDPLFAVAIENRYFWGASFHTDTYDVTHLGSFQPGSIPQSEQPLICAKPFPQHILPAVAVPSIDGFLAVTVDPEAATSCDSANPLSATHMSVVRYESNGGLGSSLTRKQAWGFGLADRIVNLSLARTSEGGAWIVYQSAGDNAEFPPAIMAARATPSGYVDGDGATAAISAWGTIYSALAAGSIGDTLAAAWVDSVDPSAPVIQIQLYDWSPSLGAATSIATNDAWYDGDLQVLASTEKRSVLLAWRTKSMTAFARVDCVP